MVILSDNLKMLESGDVSGIVGESNVELPLLVQEKQVVNDIIEIEHIDFIILEYSVEVF